MWFWGQIPEAVDVLQGVLDTAPDHWLGFQILRLVYHAGGRDEECYQVNRSLHFTLGNPAVVEALEQGYQDGGYSMAMTRGGETLEKQAEVAYVSPTQIALLFNMAGEVDRTAV